MKNALAGCRAVLVTCAVVSAACAAPKPAPGVHPVVSATGTDLVGGTVDGKWTSAKQIAGLIRGGERYRLYSMTKYLGDAVGGAPTTEPELDLLYVKVTPLPKTDSEVIGICGTWNALPRVPRTQSTTQKVYQDVIGALLRQKGLAESPVKITQILRVDLEGDGQEEVLISAGTVAREHLSPVHKKGDYSLVMLRRISKGRVSNILLEAEFHKDSAGFPRPSVYTVPAVLDVNGDGVLEIIVGWRCWEGDGLVVHAIKGDKVSRVLRAGGAL